MQTGFLASSSQAADDFAAYPSLLIIGMNPDSAQIGINESIRNDSPRANQSLPIIRMHRKPALQNGLMQALLGQLQKIVPSQIVIRSTSCSPASALNVV